MLKLRRIYLERISDWTDKNKMKLNSTKTKNIIFYYSKNYKFSTDLKLTNEVRVNIKRSDIYKGICLLF